METKSSLRLKTGFDEEYYNVSSSYLSNPTQ